MSEHLYFSVRMGEQTSESFDEVSIKEIFRSWKEKYPDAEIEIVEIRAHRRRDLELN